MGFLFQSLIKMWEVRFHGRGGQGAVTAANILAMAAFKEKKYTQSFPMFGTERRGAPVAAFVRIDEKPIRIRSQIYEPDAVVVLEPGLVDVVDVAEGLKTSGLIVVNVGGNPEKIVKKFGVENAKIATCDATGIAVEFGLGSRTSPIVNTAILGAYAKAAEGTNAPEKISINSIFDAIREGVPGKPEENVNAAKKAYEKTLLQEYKIEV
jgi:2-oxoacid:acceptor oxidoreductase gamma subunit (pyruvate/2-ketoisovalerate family)